MNRPTLSDFISRSAATRKLAYKWKKRAMIDNPHASFTHEGTIWRVVQAYQTPANEADNPYARWLCAVKTAYTVQPWTYAHVYIVDIPGATPGYRLYPSEIGGYTMTTVKQAESIITEYAGVFNADSKNAALVEIALVYQGNIDAWAHDTAQSVAETWRKAGFISPADIEEQALSLTNALAVAITDHANRLAHNSSHTTKPAQ